MVGARWHAKALPTWRLRHRLASAGKYKLKSGCHEELRRFWKKKTGEAGEEGGALAWMGKAAGD
jgi:hypothetical protein